MISSEDVVSRDLEHICNNLTAEFIQLSGKKVLITGGAGFIGFYLIKSVLYWNENNSTSRSIQLTVFDNYSRGIPSWLERIQSDQNFNLEMQDITKPLPQGLDAFHYIIHAASIASPTYYRKHPIETMDANVVGLRQLLEYSKNRKETGNPVESFLFFSTSEIYGDPFPENIPTPESYNGNVSCVGPRACYDESKRYGETLCVNFALQYNLPVKIVRPFNNYGPGLKITDRRLLPDFAEKVLSGRDIVLYSDGTPTRTFCYIADAIIGYYKILVRGKNGQAYNIGVETPEISVLDFAKMIVNIAGELFDYQGKIVRKVSPDPDYLADNPNRRCPVITKAQSELGYNPNIQLNEGLRRSLIWYSENNEAEDR